MHRLVDVKHGLAERTQSRKDACRHQSMAPVRNRGIGVKDATTAPDLAECRARKALWIRDGQGGTTNLRHGGRDEVADHKLNVDAAGSEFASQSRRPVLQERLATGVGGQERTWEETGKGAHGEDQSALALNHTGHDELSDAQSTEAVDSDNIFHFRLGSRGEGYGNAMAQSDIVDQNRDIHIFDQGPKIDVVLILVHRKVHRMRLRLDIGLAFDFSSDSGEFLGRTRHQNNVVPCASELERIFLSNAVSRACDESPAALGTEGSQL